MGLITSALQIGRSALLAYQSALQVTGNNVSNAGSSTYTRQTPVLGPGGGGRLPEGFMPGGGVMLTALRRNVDEALENRLRVSTGDLASARTQQQTVGQIEGLLNELSDSDLSSLLENFFAALSQLQNQPHDISTRGMVLTAGDSLVQEIRRQREGVLALRDELNEDLEDAARRADEIAREIADLNVQIVALEGAGQGAAGSLRDQRDGLLRELGEIVQVQVREQPGGGVNVYVGNEPLVQNGLSRGIATTLEVTNGEPRVIVGFADSHTPLRLLGGRMAGIVAARDTNVMGQVSALNSLATALITAVNKVHSQGQGLEGWTEVVGASAVLDPNAALNGTGAGLKLTPRNGSFLITLRDQETGASTTTTITVDLDGIGTDESLQSLVDQINGNVAHVTAAVTAGQNLQLTAASGFEMTFAEDSSNVLAALGVNTFFVGEDARDIAVNDALKNNLNLLAAATTNAPGDGSNASRMAALGSDALAGLGGRSLADHYNAMASDVAVKGAAAQAAAEAAEAITSALTAQRESVSGVSLDEEAISLLRFERSFQAAARYTAVVDRLIQEMLALVG